jgi:hypothetical protein
MASLPRPLLALLIAVLVIFAAWMTVLKPSSSSSPSTPAPQVAVHPATSVHAQSKPKPAAAATHSAATTAVAKPTAAQRRLAAVDAALRSGQVLALLFYNPAGADDQADRHEIAAIPSPKGKVFKLAIPVQDLSRYGVITDQVPVTGTPTLVVIDAHHRASTLAGFADQLEINQLVAGALGAK